MLEGCYRFEKDVQTNTVIGVLTLMLKQRFWNSQEQQLGLSHNGL